MRSKLLFITSVVLIVLLALLAGCGRTDRKSPADVVKAFYMAGNEGKYSEAEKYLSSEALVLMKSELGALVGGMKGAMDEATKEGTIERIEILEEEIRGEGATVRLILHFRDGMKEEDDESLIQERGAWKITAGS